MNDIIQSFETSRPEFNLLSEGEHIVRLSRYEILDSFTQYSHEPKAELPAWSNACPQLAITVLNAEEGKSGGLTHRLNFEGYVKYEELSEAQIKSGKYENVEGYACTKKGDDLVRAVDEEKTKTCANIANQFAMALGIPEGTNLIEGLDMARDEQVTFRVTVVNEPYDGRDQLRLSRFRQIARFLSKQTSRIDE